MAKKPLPSSSSSDEVEPQPTKKSNSAKNPPSPAPAADQGNAGSGSDDEENEGESSEEEPAKRQGARAGSHPKGGDESESSDEESDDEGGSSEELGEHGTPVENLSAAVTQPKKSSTDHARVPSGPARPSAAATKKNPPPPAPAPAHQRNGGSDSDDEHGSKSSDDDDEGGSFMVCSRRNEAGEPDGMPLEPSSQKKENVPPAEVTAQPQMKRKVLEAEPVKLPETATHAEAEEQLKSDAEQLEEKLGSYRYLWEEVMALETRWSDMFKGSFLNDPDDLVRELDTKVKKQRLAELNVHAQRDRIDKDVKKTLIDLLK